MPTGKYGDLLKKTHGQQCVMNARAFFSSFWIKKIPSTYIQSLPSTEKEEYDRGN
jgi:hypothetical protein